MRIRGWKEGSGVQGEERDGGQGEESLLEERPCFLVTVSVFGEGWPDGIAYVPWRDRDTSGRRLERLSPLPSRLGHRVVVGSGGNPKAGQLCAARMEWLWVWVWWSLDLFHCYLLSIHCVPSPVLRAGVRKRDPE